MKNYPRLYGEPLKDPLQTKSLLRDPELHWKKGRSAYEAAHSWVTGNINHEGGMPRPVRNMLNQAPEWTEAEVAVGLFEHATPLDTLQRPSSNDLLVVCRLQEALGVMAVEAKAGEPFGELVSVWNSTPGRSARLAWACDFFDVEAESCGGLRWQLFHRTTSAIIEAKRFHAPHAIMLVHDFGEKVSWRDDYVAFAETIGVTNADFGRLSDPKLVGGVSLRMGWVRDSSS
ncbi:DUF6946 family protein [Hyphomonas sp.]|uniref:DUF6946 family protein n=1 Tax=Hyphomonas sp. TaxID=87 RepID=UPI003D2B6DF6